MLDSIKKDIRDYLLEEFLPGEDPAALQDDTPLISTGILDSLATVKLVLFLEKGYGIEISPHETGIDYLNSVEEIARLVESKRAGA